MALTVRFHPALEGKSGKELSVCAQQARTLTKKCVLSALMAKSGTKFRENVFAKMAISGIANTVRKLMIALETVSGTQLTTNAYAGIHITGAVTLACLSLLAKEANIGTQS